LIVFARIACAALATLLFAPRAPAQLPLAPPPEAGAESHILSAFTSRADPRVFAERVILGPRLRAELGEARGAQVYEALMERTAGKPLRSRRLTGAEAASMSSISGVDAAEPIVLLKGGDVLLLLQYARQQFNVAFVEQLEGAAVGIAPAPPPPPPPPAASVVEVAPAAPPTPVVEKPKPTPPLVVKRAQSPPPAPSPRAEKPRPSGPCVIRPVMSDDDLYNCGAAPR
jgi:hypothetical protein